VAVLGVLQSILQVPGVAWHEPLNDICALRDMAIASARHEFNHLAEGELVSGHRILHCRRRWQGSAARLTYSGLRLAAEVLPFWPGSSSKLTF